MRWMMGRDTCGGWWLVAAFRWYLEDGKTVFRVLPPPPPSLVFRFVLFLFVFVPLRFVSVRLYCVCRYPRYDQSRKQFRVPTDALSGLACVGDFFFVRLAMMMDVCMPFSVYTSSPACCWIVPTYGSGSGGGSSRQLDERCLVYCVVPVLEYRRRGCEKRHRKIPLWEEYYATLYPLVGTRTLKELRSFSGASTILLIPAVSQSTRTTAFNTHPQQTSVSPSGGYLLYLGIHTVVDEHLGKPYYPNTTILLTVDSLRA